MSCPSTLLRPCRSLRSPTTLLGGGVPRVPPGWPQDPLTGPRGSGQVRSGRTSLEREVGPGDGRDEVDGPYPPSRDGRWASPGLCTILFIRRLYYKVYILKHPTTKKVTSDIHCRRARRDLCVRGRRERYGASPPPLPPRYRVS